jgi:hypothetical protein
VKAIDLDVSKWHAWRPEEVPRLLDGVRVPWYVAAGWALQLFAGSERREHEDLSRLIERTDDGIPYGKPEVVLLFKAKHAHEDKSQKDFEATLPQLDSARLRWLRDSLERVHPGHRWLDAL